VTATQDSVEAGRQNRDVGTRLLYENARVRVWEIVLEPGERAPFHCHEGDYFWTCVEAGAARTCVGNGMAYVQQYASGQTSYFSYPEGEFVVHDLENVGTGRLRFVTVELLTTRQAGP
jgi:quercetin dioxygenase-like cupin family protein